MSPRSGRKNGVPELYTGKLCELFGLFLGQVAFPVCDAQTEHTCADQTSFTPYRQRHLAMSPHTVPATASATCVARSLLR
jgi:hypothetical protein